MENSTHKENEGNFQEKNYDRAITLIQYHVQLFWLVFGAFLLSETVLLGGIASIAKEGNKIWIFSGAVFGFLLCIPWWTTFLYNHAFYQLRINEAGSLETSEDGFFTNGLKLFKGEKVKDVIIPRYVRFLHPKRAIRFLIFLYLISFISIAIFNFPF